MDPRVFVLRLTSEPWAWSTAAHAFLKNVFSWHMIISFIKFLIFQMQLLFLFHNNVLAVYISSFTQFSNSTVAFVALAVLLVCFWTKPWCSWWLRGCYPFSQRFFSLAPAKRINILEAFLFFFPFAFHFFCHLPLAETLDGLSSICTGTTADPHSDFLFAFWAVKQSNRFPAKTDMMENQRETAVESARPALNGHFICSC